MELDSEEVVESLGKWSIRAESNCGNDGIIVCVWSERKEDAGELDVSIIVFIVSEIERILHLNCLYSGNGELFYLFDKARPIN